MKRMCITLILFVLTLPCARAAQYTIADLGILSGYASSHAVALNNHGQVIGYSLTSGFEEAHSFLYSGGVMTDFNELSGANAQVADINDSGAVVGSLIHYAPEGQCPRYTAFVWTSFEGLTDLGALSDNGLSGAEAINNNSEVTGNSDGKAFIWDKQGGMRAIANAFGGSGVNAYDIDNSGRVFGSAQDAGPNHDWLPFFYDGSAMTNLRELGMTGAGILSNDSGQIAGILYPGHAFIWSESAGMHDLGSIGEGYYCSSISGLNNSGEVVGIYQNTSGTGSVKPFLYSDGRLFRLEDLIPANSGWSIQSAADINDHGQIVGQGYYNGAFRAFLMTPVPEPSSLLALAGGLAGLGVGVRKRVGRRRG